MKRGRSRTDIGNKLVPELGYSLYLWGEQAGRAYSLNIQSGGYSKWVGNSLVLTLPADGPLSLAESAGRLAELFHGLVAVWEPGPGALCDSAAFEWDGKKIGRKIARNIPAVARYDGETPTPGGIR